MACLRPSSGQSPIEVSAGRDQVAGSAADLARAGAEMPEGAARAALFTSPRAFGASLQTRAFTVVDLDLDGERIAHALRHGAEVLELCERPIQFVERASGRAEREAHAHPLHPHAVLPIAAHGEVHLAATGLRR